MAAKMKNRRSINSGLINAAAYKLLFRSLQIDFLFPVACGWEGCYYIATWWAMHVQ